MTRQEMAERIVALCARKPHSAAMLRDALGQSVGQLLSDLARAGRMQKEIKKPGRLCHLFNPRMYFYSTTPQGARWALACIEARKEEEAAEAAQAVPA